MHRLPTTETHEYVEQPLTVRAFLSRTAVQFMERHPDEVQRIVATAIEAAAAREAAENTVPTRANVVDTLPEALRRFVTITSTSAEAGRGLNISEAAELLQVTRATVYAWIESKRLLAWRATRRGTLIPAEQILGPGKVVAGIDRVLAVIPDPAAAWVFLTEESPFVDANASLRPIDALKAGNVELVIAAAHSFLEAFT